MDYLLLHRISAFTFFISYNLFIFCFGMFRSSKYVRKGMFSMFIGSLMLLSSLLLLPFPSYGIFEITYFLLLLYWNGHLFYKRIRIENRSATQEAQQVKQTTLQPHKTAHRLYYQINNSTNKKTISTNRLL